MMIEVVICVLLCIVLLVLVKGIYIRINLPKGIMYVVTAPPIWEDGEDWEIKIVKYRRVS